MSLGVAILAFAIAAGVLVRAGVALASAGDQLAERTGWGRTFVGALLVAVATSLPEVVTDVTLASSGAPDLAVGDLFGSSMANMAILAVLDLYHHRRVWPTVELAHARIAAVAILLTAIAALGIYTPPDIRIGWIGTTPLVIFAIYIAAIAWLRRRRQPGEVAVSPSPITLLEVTGWDQYAETAPQTSRIVARFVLATVVIFLSAPVVALSAEVIAAESGIDQTMLGASLLAITTSMPELVASLAAVRIGAYDLAVGNLFGSNAINMSILLFADLAYTPGPILSAIDPPQVVAALGAIILMALALAAILAGTETRIRRLEPDAIVLLLAYVGVLLAIALSG
ncbi:MAG: hypothetical protein R2849_21745 [Thermomicrobiales bacterium]